MYAYMDTPYMKYVLRTHIGTAHPIYSTVINVRRAVCALALVAVVEVILVATYNTQQNMCTIYMRTDRIRIYSKRILIHHNQVREYSSIQFQQNGLSSIYGSDVRVFTLWQTTLYVLYV